MNASHTCPLCAHPVLRHIRAGAIYWFCRYCRQEVPVLEPSPNFQVLQGANIPASSHHYLFNSLEHCLK